MPKGTWNPKQPGPPGPQGPAGPTGPAGPQGPAGSGLRIKGSVATVGALPATGNSDQDAYNVTGTGNMHVWSAATGVWVNIGPFQGPQGPAGPAGPAGPTGATGAQGPTGPAGAAGANGQGVPAGGTSGQVLAKTSATDYATGWVTPSTTGSTSSGPIDLATSTATTGLLDAQTKLANLQDAVATFISPSTDPNPDTYVLRRPTGTVTGASATGNDEFPPLQQVRALIAASSTAGAVLSQRATTTLPLSSNTDGTFKDAPARLNLTGARSGERYRHALWVAYKGVTGATGGIIFRVKTAGSAVTNKLVNPAANTDVTGWNITNATLTRETTTTQEGPGAFRIEATSAGTVSFYSDWVTGVAATQTFSAAAQWRRSTATARNVRVDVQFGDDTATNASLSTGVIGAFLGAQASPGTTAYTRVLSDSANRSGTATGAAIAPAGTTKARVRMVILTAAVGDVFFVDAAQLEPTDPVPAYGTTGGGSSVVSFQGDFEALPATGTITAASPRVPTEIVDAVGNSVSVSAQARSATANATLVGSFDVLIGGSGLTDQAVGWEFAQLGANATATQITAAWATWARVESPA